MQDHLWGNVFNFKEHIPAFAASFEIFHFDFQKEELDQDMIVDATLCLWNKCKVIFQRYQTGAMDSPKYLNKMDNPGKVSQWEVGG